MKKEYAAYQQIWLKSDACAVLKSELAQMRGNLDIGNVVCLGLGSFCAQSPWSSHVQLAGLMTIISYLRKLVFKTYQARR
jgi:SRR1